MASEKLKQELAIEKNAKDAEKQKAPTRERIDCSSTENSINNSHVTSLFSLRQKYAVSSL